MEDLFQHIFLVRLADSDKRSCPLCGVGTIITCPDLNTANHITQTVNQQRLLFRFNSFALVIKAGFIFALSGIIVGLIFQKIFPVNPELLYIFSTLAVFYGLLYIFCIITFYIAIHFRAKHKLKKEIEEITGKPSKRNEK